MTRRAPASNDLIPVSEIEAIIVPDTREAHRLIDRIREAQIIRAEREIPERER